jgi:hypothetical protein
VEIQTRVKNENKYDVETVRRFVDLLQTLHEDDRTRVLFATDDSLFRIFMNEGIQSHLPAFLSVYGNMVERAEYSWSYAETIAGRMQVLFDAPSVATTEKLKALELAIIAADRQNRFAAMDACRAMIFSIREEGLAMRVAEMLPRFFTTFIGNIEPENCGTQALRGLFEELKKNTHVPPLQPGDISLI